MDGSESEEAFRRLRAAGWAIVVVPLPPDVWIVEGVNGENRILVDAPTEVDAWREALEQARAVGMLGGVRPGEPGAG